MTNQIDRLLEIVSMSPDNDIVAKALDEAYAPVVARAARKAAFFLADQWEARAVAHDALVSLWLTREERRPKTIGWVTTVAANSSRTLITSADRRRRAPIEAAEYVLSGDLAEAEVELGERRAAVRRILAEMMRHPRPAVRDRGKVLTLYHLFDLPMRRIAEILGLNYCTACSMARRGRKHFAARWAAEMGEAA